jgi:CheY-like chemotaxis protein/two-component sensor histidine kinase
MRKRRRVEPEEQARRLAEREAAQDDFLAHLSHELRTPLQAVIGWTEMLMADGAARSSDAEAALQRGLQVILRNAKLQARLIDDMMDVASLARGQLQLTLAPLELDAVVRAAVESVANSARAKAMELRVSLTSSSVVVADGQRLQQVVSNLLTNAIKFSSPGAPIDVRTLRRARRVVIEVEDRGPGIEPELLPVLFERFRQGRAGRGANAGMGLGLAIVKGLVELHAGEVHASSGERGARLSVLLPCAPDGTASEPPPPLGHDDIAASALTGKRVAIVDDDADSVEAVRATLMRAGATVAAFTSPDALLASAAHEADVLLLDLGMDDLSGIDLLAVLRGRGVRAPAIALTGFAFEKDRTRALDGGFQLHVGKPVDGRELLAAVVRALSARC